MSMQGISKSKGKGCMEGSVLRDKHGIQKGVFAVLFSHAGDPEIPIFDFCEDIHCRKQSHNSNKFVRVHSFLLRDLVY
jgi:hypothetical protein